MPRERTPLFRVNISGHTYILQTKNIKRDPFSRLGKLSVAKQKSRMLELCDYFDPQLKVFYFMRCPKVFNYVLSYYRTGDMHLPTDDQICSLHFLEEIRFWQISVMTIGDCCRPKLPPLVFARPPPDLFEGQALRSIREPIYRGLTNPYCATWSKIYAIVTVMTIILTAIFLIILSFPSYTRPKPLELYERELNEVGNDTSKLPGVFQIESTDAEVRAERAANYALIHNLNGLCIGWFTIDLFLAWFSSPRPLRFPIQLLTIITLISIIPYYIQHILGAINPLSYNSVEADEILNALGVFRILMFFRFVRYYERFKIIAIAIKNAIHELAFLAALVVIVNLILGVLMYYVERWSDESPFTNIPTALYWSFITLTTVGYGDYVPKGASGMVVACIAVLIGMTALAFPASIVLSKFSEAFTMVAIEDRLGERGLIYMATDIPAPTAQSNLDFNVASMGPSKLENFLADHENNVNNGSASEFIPMQTFDIYDDSIRPGRSDQVPQEPNSNNVLKAKRKEKRSTGSGTDSTPVSNSKAKTDVKLQTIDSAVSTSIEIHLDDESELGNAPLKKKAAEDLQNDPRESTETEATGENGDRTNGKTKKRKKKEMTKF